MDEGEGMWVVKCIGYKPGVGLISLQWIVRRIRMNVVFDTPGLSVL